MLDHLVRLRIMTPLFSVSEVTSPEAIEGLLALIRAGEPILDLTYGNGVFWQDSQRNVVGMDLNPDRAKDICGSFLDVPYPAHSFPTVIYDPPFHPFVGSAEEKRFSGLGMNEKELKRDFQQGCREAWRVTSRHLIVKCQDFVHNHTPQWMPLWAIEVLGEPFEWLKAQRKAKRISGRWTNVKSLYRNHADYLVFDKWGNKR